MKSSAATGSEKFDFRLTVHQLRPWPEKDALLSIGWQRGKNKKGAVTAVPAKKSSKPYALYEYNETIEVNATLKRVRPLVPAIAVHVHRAGHDLLELPART